MHVVLADVEGQAKDANTLVLTEGTVLGGGAFSRVSIVTGMSGGGWLQRGNIARSAAVCDPACLMCMGVQLSSMHAWYQH